VYKLLLIRKYLLRRRIAWVALLAVMLCTAMVLVVISVMGGWLNMFKSSFRGMTSDIVVRAESLTGYPYYQEMIDGITRLPQVKAAVPVIQTFGLINIGNQKRKPVEVVGFPIGQIGNVSSFPQTLYRQWTLEHKAVPSFGLLPGGKYEQWAGRRARNPLSRPGMIVTDPVIDLGSRQKPPKAMYELPTTLTLLPVLPGEAMKAEDAVTPAFWIVDNSRSQIYQLDSDRVYVPLDELQKDLRMSATGGADGDPARVTEIQIKAVDGADLNAVRDQVQGVVDKVRDNHFPWPDDFPLQVATWQQVQAKFIDFVEHEVVLTTTLFGVISLVAILLIFCMFYMIVVEKTKDIGIIKSVGATGGGILMLFLGYGLAIGIVGGGLGLTLAYGVVHNINELHAWLGREMGIVIWDPEAYQFAKIPNTMDPKVAFWVLVVAMVSALVGAVVPAIRAARKNPVEALRYE
jgi:lipoprotein-releasing system permease protein